VVIIPSLTTESINFEKYRAELEKFKEDYLTVRNTLGPKWKKFAEKGKKLIAKHSKDIEKLGRDMDVNLTELCNMIVEYIEPSLHELNLYLDPETKLKLTEEEIDTIQEKMIGWKKVSFSSALSVGVGAGGAAAAKSLLVPATFWNSFTSFFGFGSGYLVSASTFTAATVYAPIALGGLAFFLGIKGLKKIENIKLSHFLSDVIIASMPMIYADGEVHEKEVTAINFLMNNPAIYEKDRKRMIDAMNNPLDLDFVILNQIMYEPNGEKSKIKARLLLSMAWHLSKADGKIHEKEIEMHNKMARIFQVEEPYCQEVRALLTPAIA
jgi:uncharacterized tellurite resistance protein B-like protein